MEIDFELAKEAFEEAHRRYPEADAALAFLWVASGIGIATPTPEDIQWAKDQLMNASAGETPKLGPR